MSAFSEGERAFDAEVKKEDCPYPFDSTPGIEWCAGWEAAENENAQAWEGQWEDWRLDDPRHGQGAGR